MQQGRSTASLKYFMTAPDWGRLHSGIWFFCSYARASASLSPCTQFSFCVRRFNDSRTASGSSFIHHVRHGVAKRANAVGKACERCCQSITNASAVRAALGPVPRTGEIVSAET